MTKEQQDTWLAGLFDGEGTVIISTNPRGELNIKVNIAQHYCPELLEVIHKAVGFGWVNDNRWSCSMSNAYDFLLRIEPYIIVKRVEIMFVKEFMTTLQKGTNQYNQDDAKTLKRLKLHDAWRSFREQQKAGRRETR